MHTSISPSFHLIMYSVGVYSVRMCELCVCVCVCVCGCVVGIRLGVCERELQILEIWVWDYSNKRLPCVTSHRVICCPISNVGATEVIKVVLGEPVSQHMAHSGPYGPQSRLCNPVCGHST